MTRGRYIRNGIIATLIVGIGSIPYIWLGQNTDMATAARLDMPLDHMIPFLPWTVLIYSWVYTQMFYPLFILRGEDLFWRTVKAFVFIVAFDLLIYWIYPVTAHGFRPEHTDVPVTWFADWGAKLTFYLDPPTNLFPSQHMSTALLVCIVAWLARPAWGKLILPLTILICLSILTMKQHYIADGLAAIAVTFIAWWLFLRTYRRENDELPASTWRGPLTYFVYHGAFYLTMYVAYLNGYAPWDN